MAELKDDGDQGGHQKRQSQEKAEGSEVMDECGGGHVHALMKFDMGVRCERGCTGYSGQADRQ